MSLKIHPTRKARLSNGGHKYENFHFENLKLKTNYDLSPKNVGSRLIGEFRLKWIKRTSSHNII